jgi:UPF0755 protein
MAMSNSSKAFVVVLVLAGVVAGAGAWWLLADVGAPEASNGRVVEFEVPEGVGTSQIAGDLAEAGVISSEWAFRIAARFDERSERLQAGTHRLRAGMTSDEVLAALSSEPHVETFRLTIPEGLTVEQTLTRLAEAGDYEVPALRAALTEVELPGWVPADQLPESAEPYEGLLFPETYQFRTDAAPGDVLQRLVGQTESVMEGVQPPQGVSRYEMLIVASLVEREAKVSEEQPTIASVIYNRLSAPMRLQVDATVIYARDEDSGPLTNSDLEIDSPWNTYQRDGLPPTPIAAPGRGAIEAAANPSDTDYRYYVVDDLEAGSHAFAETKAQHDANVREYRRMREQQQAEDQGAGGGAP